MQCPGGAPGAPGISFLEAAPRRLFGTGIGRANDDPRFSHSDMLRCFDAAIAMAEAAGTAGALGVDGVFSDFTDTALVARSTYLKGSQPLSPGQHPMQGDEGSRRSPGAGTTGPPSAGPLRPPAS